MQEAAALFCLCVAAGAAGRAIWEDRQSCEILWVWPVLFALAALLAGAFAGPVGWWAAVLGGCMLGMTAFAVRLWFRWRLGFESLGLADVIVLIGIGGSMGPTFGGITMALGAMGGIGAMAMGGFGARSGLEAGVDTERTVLPLLPFLLGVWALVQGVLVAALWMGLDLWDLARTAGLGP